MLPSLESVKKAEVKCIKCQQEQCTLLPHPKTIVILSCEGSGVPHVKKNNNNKNADANYSWSKMRIMDIHLSK